MTYATVKDGVIINITEGFIDNNDICLYDIPAMIGDTYDGQYFYHNGERIYSMAENHYKELKMMREILGIPFIEEDD